MRTRINRNALCSSENYRASRRTHIEALQREHEAFVSSKLHTALLAVATPSEPSDNTEVFVTILGRKTKVPYSTVKSAGYSWSWT